FIITKARASTINLLIEPSLHTTKQKVPICNLQTVVKSILLKQGSSDCREKILLKRSEVATNNFKMRYTMITMRAYGLRMKTFFGGASLYVAVEGAPSTNI
uniref:Uncharacterized protein n=1 Tax=Ciona intestinalis TaxID=7719 RepID=H2XKL5_CIOIN